MPVQGLKALGGRTHAMLTQETTEPLGGGKVTSSFVEQAFPDIKEDSVRGSGHVTSFASAHHQPNAIEVDRTVHFTVGFENEPEIIDLGHRGDEARV